MLKDLNIPIISSDTGGKIGRTMVVDLENFYVSIKNGSKEIKRL
ncbi:MAG: hypothetical protein ACTHW2_01975 [Tissierella sp.]